MRLGQGRPGEEMAFDSNRGGATGGWRVSVSLKDSIGHHVGGGRGQS